MTSTPQQRGAARVGYVADLVPVEAGAVQGLRAWRDGPEALNVFQVTLGYQIGEANADAAGVALSQLCDLCFRHGRRPLARHHAASKCLGADESCFANFVAAAGEGAHEDAILLATLLVRPDFAPCMIGLAANLGAALQLTANTLTCPPRLPHS